MRYLVVLVALVMLTGCGPSKDAMDAAWARCTSEANLWVAQHPDATTAEAADAIVAVAEKCDERRETIGDEKFVEVYGD